MSTDAPLKPPRKKPGLFWWIVGTFLVLMLLFFIQLFGTSPRIIVSPQTTYITGPLRPDGLPDYEAFIRDLSRHGVTAENNAAAIIWPALWPGELDPPHYGPVAAELGLDVIPNKSAALVTVYKALSTHTTDAAADNAFEHVTSRPWTSSQFPALAKWATDNKQQLDALVEASQRSHCYFPSPSLLDGQPDQIVMMMLPGPQSAREVGRSLSARAMWHVGERRPAEAWQDLLAGHRLSRLVAQGPALVERIVGMAISNIACGCTVAALDESQQSAEELRRALHDLMALDQFAGVSESLDQMERVMFLDFVISLGRGEVDAQALSLMEEDPRFAYLHHVRVDWNAVLRESNEYFDRLVAAGRMNDRPARQQALAKIEADLANMERGQSIRTLLAVAVNPSDRNEIVAARLLSANLIALQAVFESEDRGNTNLALARLAAALAVHRAEHQTYPEKLEELVPGVLATLPADVYSSSPFIYKRTTDGYLLYSAGENGRDDGGSYRDQNIYQGVQLHELNDRDASAAQTDVNRDSDDISIRVPRPPIKLPKTPPAEVAR